MPLRKVFVDKEGDDDKKSINDALSWFLQKFTLIHFPGVRELQLLSNTINKGQLISEANFLVLIWTKKWTNLFLNSVLALIIWFKWELENLLLKFTDLYMYWVPMHTYFKVAHFTTTSKLKCFCYCFMLRYMTTTTWYTTWVHSFLIHYVCKSPHISKRGYGMALDKGLKYFLQKQSFSNFFKFEF